MSATYDFKSIEPKWRQRWDAARVSRAANPGEPGGEKPKFYVLDFFPYPSGAGLHVGHPLGYIASDIIARFHRMRGFNVLHPMGWDAFGLPAEQYAVEHNVHPRITTRRNIETFKQQLRLIGLSYDWSREFATCDEDYYRWTQWIFLQIYKSWYDPEAEWTDPAGRRVVGRARPIGELPIPPEIRAKGDAAVEEYQARFRLAYLAEVPVNWCPALGTVLSNEEVTNEGRSERGDHPVFRRPMKQWMLRITAYADRLIRDLNGLDWPEPIKLMQRNWIGRSEGAYVDFPLAGVESTTIRIFTTRPDTLYGATYMVLAPEHALVEQITTPAHADAVRAYVAQARNRSDLDRTAETREKTGVFTGGYAINPVTGEKIPIWTADYVLMGYGTGAIMAVPGHDTRDLEFAEAFGLPIVQVVQPPDSAEWRGFVEDGVSVNSPPPNLAKPDACILNGLPTPEAKRKIIAWLDQQKLGEGTVQFKLRDWLFSRQRYWGEPFPILYREDGRIVPESEDRLPVRLPELTDFRPHASDDPNAEPQTPLSRAADWITVERGGEVLRRETNTMPNWAGSCWYYLRFCDPADAQFFIAPEVEWYWAGPEPQTEARGLPSASEPRTEVRGLPDTQGRVGSQDHSPSRAGPLLPREVLTDSLPPQSASRKPQAIGFVDLYMGGAEHAVLHLLYARFWHKLLYDRGYLSTPEPFQRLFNQGMISSLAYRDARGVYIGYDDVEFRDSVPYHRQTGERLTESVEKMSKTLKNVVNPDTVIADYGADTLRLYEMYMGPLEVGKPWNTRDIIGVHRFLQRIWRLVIESQEATERRSDEGHTRAQRDRAPENRADEEARPDDRATQSRARKEAAPGDAPTANARLDPRPGESEREAQASGPPESAAWRISSKIADTPNADLERLLHKTIKKVEADIQRFALNTAIAEMIKWVNEATKAESVGRSQIERFLTLLAPFAPHIADELSERLGHTGTLAHATWPAFDEALTRDDEVEIAVQINGKIRARIQIPAEAAEDAAAAIAAADPAIARELAGKTLRKRIYVKGRLLNLIVG